MREVGLQQVLEAVRQERARQEAKWGEQNHTPMEWLSVLGEEVGEACRGANEAHWHRDLVSWRSYREEMIHVAACAVAAVACLDRQGGWP